MGDSVARPSNVIRLADFGRPLPVVDLPELLFRPRRDYVRCWTTLRIRGAGHRDTPGRGHLSRRGHRLALAEALFRMGL